MISNCEVCDKTGQVWCCDCEDEHECESCKGVGFLNKNKKPLFCDVNGRRVKLIKASREHVWLLSVNAKPSANWDIVVTRDECSNWGEE